MEMRFIDFAVLALTKRLSGIFYLAQNRVYFLKCL